MTSKDRLSITWDPHRRDRGRSSAPQVPTTSSRMDAFTPRLLEAGLKAMIGKGERSAAVREAIVKIQSRVYGRYRRRGGAHHEID